MYRELRFKQGFPIRFATRSDVTKPQFTAPSVRVENSFATENEFEVSRTILYTRLLDKNFLKSYSHF